MTQPGLPLTGSPDRRPKVTLNDRLAEYFKARPNQWINARELLAVAGFAAWRTLVSDLRRPRARGGRYEMVIENETRQRQLYDGGWVTDSFYRYVPAGTRTETAA